MKIAEEITKEVCDSFPEETKKYRQLIYDSVCRILEKLPQNMTPEKYKEIVFQHMKIARDGKLN